MVTEALILMGSRLEDADDPRSINRLNEITRVKRKVKLRSR